jgi:dolichol-phosphate mannosyltransferase
MTIPITVIVPTRNESLNIKALVDRLEAVLCDLDARVLFVDDSTDNTPAVIRDTARESSLPIELVHRSGRQGGLGGAVVAGFGDAATDWCLVMDGDLQHPPELIPVMLAAAAVDVDDDVDVVVASRYVRGGSSGGLDGGLRHLVSRASTVLARALFPRRLRGCTDPMTGFFAIRTSAIDLDQLHPRGFKILLELLVRNPLRIAEVPLVFGERTAGNSKTSLREGARFVRQLTRLRLASPRA